MQTPYKPFNTVLLLASQFEMAAIDRQVLKGANIHISRILTSGIEAATYLTTAQAKDQQVPDFILCHEQLADMTGKEFITLLRQHSDFMAYPIILAVSEQQKNPAGCSAILIRPYALDALNAKIALAAESQTFTNTVLTNTTKRTNDAFNTALAEYQAKRQSSTNAIKKLYNEALFAAKVNDFDKAIMHLKNCLRINAGFKPAQSALEKIIELRARHRKTNSQQTGRASTPAIKKIRPSSVPTTVPSLDAMISLDPSLSLDTMLSLDTVYIEDVPLDDGQNAPIRMHSDTKKPPKIQKFTSPLREPSPPTLLANFPKIHEALTIARITFSLLRRL